MTTLQVVVTGGAGQIAYSLIPLIARGLVFGPSTRVHLRLLDIPPAAGALEGVAMEVQDSLFSTVLDGTIATTDERQAFSDAQVAILLGGFPRRPGMERGDLIGKNAGIMQKMGEALERYACRSCKVVVVANPAPTNCLVLAAHAPSLPRKNFSCLSRLDHDRMVGILLDKANKTLDAQGIGSSTGGAEAEANRLVPADVRGACVWGNHSNSQVPDASAVELRVNGRWTAAASVINDGPWLSLTRSSARKSLVEAVRSRGAAVLRARKLSSAMSAANAIAGHLSDWTTSGTSEIGRRHLTDIHAVSTGPTLNHRYMKNNIRNNEHPRAVSMGVMSDGNPFGVPEGLFCSFPVRCCDGHWTFDDAFHLGDEARRQLDTSIAELQEEKSMVAKLLTATIGGKSPSYDVAANGRPMSNL